MQTVSYHIRKNGGGKRAHVEACVVEDGKARMVWISEHNTWEAAERKARKLEAAKTQPQY